MSFSFIISIATMGGLAFLFVLFLPFADKKLKVEENTLIANIYANAIKKIAQVAK